MDRNVTEAFSFNKSDVLPVVLKTFCKIIDYFIQEARIDCGEMFLYLVWVSHNEIRLFVEPGQQRLLRPHLGAIVKYSISYSFL